MKRVASIDIGSQTIRLLVGEVSDAGAIAPLRIQQSIVRLGEGVRASGMLADAAMSRALACIADYADQARDLKAEPIRAAATACVRDASNRREFIQRIYRRTGISLEILTGEQEARITLSGIVSALEPPGGAELVIIDIGGGSTELLRASSRSVLRSQSLPLGALGLTEQFMLQDPPAAREIAAMRGCIRELLGASVGREDYAGAGILAGTAGAITTLAAMDLEMERYESRRINGHCLRKESIVALFDAMIAMPAAQRAWLPGLDPQRARVMPAGTAILIEILELLGASRIVVSDAGLLEGLLLCI